MALEAFNKLKERKRIALITSIRDSLRKTMYESLSVGDISLEADISRGSFYNYFVDKNDAVFAMVEIGLNEQLKFFKSCIENNGGDLFSALIELYNEVSYNLKPRMDDILMNNLKIYMNIVIKIFYSEKYSKQVEELVFWLCKNTTIGKDKIVDEKDMANVLELLFSTAVHELARAFVISEERKKYVSLEKKVAIIKKGVYAA